MRAAQGRGKHPGNAPLQRTGWPQLQCWVGSHWSHRVVLRRFSTRRAIRYRAALREVVSTPLSIDILERARVQELLELLRGSSGEIRLPALSLACSETGGAARVEHGHRRCAR